QLTLVELPEIGGIADAVEKGCFGPARHAFPAAMPARPGHGPPAFRSLARSPDASSRSTLNRWARRLSSPFERVNKPDSAETSPRPGGERSTAACCGRVRGDHRSGSCSDDGKALLISALVPQREGAPPSPGSIRFAP